MTNKDNGTASVMKGMLVTRLILGVIKFVLGVLALLLLYSFLRAGGANTIFGAMESIVSTPAPKTADGYDPLPISIADDSISVGRRTYSKQDISETMSGLREMSLQMNGMEP